MLEFPNVRTNDESNVRVNYKTNVIGITAGIFWRSN